MGKTPRITVWPGDSATIYMVEPQLPEKPTLADINHYWVQLRDAQITAEIYGYTLVPAENAPYMYLAERSHMTVERVKEYRDLVDHETWDALASTWRGTVHELIEACHLVGGAA